MSAPVSVALDSNNGLYVAEYSNNRITFFNSASTSIARVYGQGSFSANSANHGGAVGPTTLRGPTFWLVLEPLYQSDI
jgi:hypothetical protein